MKKLMLLPLLAGVIWVCPASPVAFSSFFHSNQLSQMKISQDLLFQIFEAAVPKFYSEYSITTSVAELQTGYEDGIVTVEEIAGGGAWRVTFGGNVVISDSEDFL